MALLLVLFCSLATVSLAQVPAKNQFRYVNEGEFGPYITEYDASYRVTQLAGSPFQLMWYNATPGQYYLGLRMGLARSESIRRWVWDANRGRPVGENATLTFARDGNLVLAEANGRVVWSTATANKGATGVRILNNGNIVVHDKKGRFLWQSFDHPTDTLLVGQSLYFGGPTKLVSRRSATDNSDGIYSFELEPTGMKLYLTTSSSSGRLQYSDDNVMGSDPSGSLKNATFLAELAEDGSVTRLTFPSVLIRPKYNATLSFLRVAVDGNLEMYTYYDPVDYNAWERTYVFFSEDGFYSNGCDLPSRCGALGVCEEDMCVACPTAKGLRGWSRSCSAPAAGIGAPCRSDVGYYKVTGVESFVPRHNKGLGKMNLEACKAKCTADCNCLGFFYYAESGGCWLAPVLGSLAKVDNSSHVAYIKSVA